MRQQRFFKLGNPNNRETKTKLLISILIRSNYFAFGPRLARAVDTILQDIKYDHTSQHRGD